MLGPTAPSARAMLDNCVTEVSTGSPARLMPIGVSMTHLNCRNYPYVNVLPTHWGASNRGREGRAIVPLPGGLFATRQDRARSDTHTTFSKVTFTHSLTQFGTLSPGVFAAMLESTPSPARKLQKKEATREGEPRSVEAAPTSSFSALVSGATDPNRTRPCRCPQEASPGVDDVWPGLERPGVSSGATRATQEASS
jgi:hypothetical protein